MKKKDWLPVALVGVLVLGTFLRFYGLGSESLWIDEGVSVDRAGLDVLRIIQEAPSDPTPPLYYLLLHYWVSFFGDSDFSVRAPSAICGSLAVLMMYRLGTLISGRTTGLLAALILAVSSLHTYYSQEARVYSLFCLLVLLSFYFFVRLLREEEPSPITAAGYVLSTVVLMYAHVYGLFVLAAQEFYLLTALVLTNRFRRRTTLLWWGGLQVAMAVLYVPGIWYLREQISHPRGRMWVDEPDLPMLGRLPELYAGSQPLAYLLLVLAVTCVVASLKPSGVAMVPGKTYLLVVWLLFSTALPFLVSKFYVVVLGHPRHTIAASLALYLLAAEGIKVLARASSAYRVAYRRPILISGVALVLTLSAPSLYERFERVNKDQWRDATHHVDAHAVRGDLVLYRNGLLFDHYCQREDLDQKNLREVPENTSMGHNGVWVLLRDGHTLPPDLERKIERSYRTAYRKRYRGIKLTFFVEPDHSTHSSTQGP